jgi:hypothetical protein
MFIRRFDCLKKRKKSLLRGVTVDKLLSFFCLGRDEVLAVLLLLICDVKGGFGFLCRDVNGFWCFCLFTSVG